MGAHGRVRSLPSDFWAPRRHLLRAYLHSAPRNGSWGDSSTRCAAPPLAVLHGRDLCRSLSYTVLVSGLSVTRTGNWDAVSIRAQANQLRPSFRSPIKWIKNPTNTLVLVGPPLKDDQGDANRRKFTGRLPWCTGQGKIPPNNYIPFNGLNDLKTKTQPYKGQGKIIWIWVHGRPGGILIGSGPGVNEPLDLNNPKEYQALLGVLKALNPSEVHFWGCNVMGKIGEKPTGNNALKNLQNDLGGIPLTAPIGYIRQNGQGGFQINPGANPVATPQ